jgi:hypothetical protein
MDKHLDRIINRLIDKANNASYTVKKPKKPCHAFRVLYPTRINEADRFSLAATCKPFLRRALTDRSRKGGIACIQ